GDIRLEGNNLYINGSLLAHASDGYAAGDIGLQAFEFTDAFAPFVHLKHTDAAIVLGSAVIKGRDISLDVLSDSSRRYGDSPEDDLSSKSEMSLDSIEGSSVIGGVAISSATAALTIGNGALIEGRNVDLRAEASTEAKLKVSSLSLFLSVAVGETDPD